MAKRKLIDNSDSMEGEAFRDLDASIFVLERFTRDHDDEVLIQEMIKVYGSEDVSEMVSLLRDFLDNDELNILDDTKRKLVTNFISLHDHYESVNVRSDEIVPVVTSEHSVEMIEKRTRRDYEAKVFLRYNVGVKRDNWINVEDVPIKPVILVFSLVENALGFDVSKDFNVFLSNHPELVSYILDVRLGKFCLKVHVKREEDRHELKDLLLKQEDFVRSFSLRFPSLHDPLIKIKNCNIEDNDDFDKMKEWVSNLYLWNKWNQELRVVWKTNLGSRGSYCTVLLQVESRIRVLIEENDGLVKTPVGQIPIEDYIPISMCQNCCRFGHKKEKCFRLTVCGFCGMGHLSNICPSKLNISCHKCPNCLKEGEDAFNKKCIVYQKLLSAEFERINHRYKFLIL